MKINFIQTVFNKIKCIHFENSNYIKFIFKLINIYDFCKFQKKNG